MVATYRGPGLSPDSINYLSSGLNLADGNGLQNFSGDALTVFPPGLPLLVAVGHWLGLNADWTVRLFNACALGLAVYLGFILLRRHLRSGLLVAVSAVLLAVSVPLLSVAKMAWTEPAFIVVCLALILLLEQLVSSTISRSWIAGAAALVWIGFMFRYAGLALIPAGAVTLLAGLRSRGLRAATIAAASFAVLSAVVPVVWMLRNHSVDGTYLGPRSASNDGLLITAKRYVWTLGSWSMPRPVPASAQHLAGIFIVVLGAAAAIWFLTGRRRRPDLRPADSGWSRLPLVTFVVAYTANIVVAQLTTAIDPIDNRFMSPLVVPAILFAAMVGERAFANIPPHAVRRFVPAMRIAGVLFVLGQAQATVRVAGAAAVYGIGYASQTSQSSPLAASAREVPAAADLYTNDPNKLWAVIRRQPLFVWQQKLWEERSALPTSSSVLSARCEGSYLAWFDGDEYDDFPPQELDEHAAIVVVSAYSDGTLYRIEPLSVAAGCV